MDVRLVGAGTLAALPREVSMRTFAIAFLLSYLLAGPAMADDAHGEMAAALAAQADLHPGRVALPTTAAAPRHAAAPSAVKRGVDPRSSASSSALTLAHQAQREGTTQALAHQAQSAAAAAAGQQQATAAKQRVDHSRPVPHR
jgi:hypothetical protein